MLRSWRPEYQAISARQSRHPCHVFSSVDEKSHSVSSFLKFSSNFGKSVAMISSEKEDTRDKTIRETAFAPVYRTIVSYTQSGLERKILYLTKQIGASR